MQRSNIGGPNALAPYAPPPGGYPSAPAANTTPAVPASRSIPTLPEMLNSLKRRWVLASFLGLLVGAAAAAAVWLYLPSGKHQVHALIQMKPTSRRVGQGTSDQNFEAFKSSQMILLKTRNLLTRVLGKEKVRDLPMIQAQTNSGDDSVRMLTDGIQLRWVSPEFLEVSMNGDDYEQVKVILNTLVTEYAKDALSEELKNRNTMIQVLKATQDDIRKKIADRESILRRVTQLGGLNGDPQTAAPILSLALSELQQAQGKLAEVGQQIQLHEGLRKDLDGRMKQVDNLPLDPLDVERFAGEDLRVRERLEQLKRAQALLLYNKAHYQPENPRITEAQDAVAQAEKDYRAAVGQAKPEIEVALRTRVRKDTENRLAQADDTLTQLNRQKANFETTRTGIENKIAELNKAMLTWQSEMNDISPLRQQLDVVSRELVQLEQVEQRSDARVQIREEAVVNTFQNFAQKIMKSGIAGVAGLLLTVVAVTFLEWQTRRVDSVAQVVDDLGIRVIGTIPAFPSKNALMSGEANADQSWRFVLNESVNSCRTMLLHAAKTESMQVLMVTSATQGEGKTSLASQLATSMATTGMRTLILDCDLRNPSMHKLFDSPVAPGCSEIMLQEVDVSDAVQPTNVPNLWLIPAGQCSHRVVAALAQGHPLETMFNRLRGQFDFIVVDSCPVLPVADALLVGQHVDGVVISVMQDVSQLPKVQTASEKLVTLNIPVLGAVVNGIKTDVYAYGYNYVKQLPA